MLFFALPIRGHDNFIMASMEQNHDLFASFFLRFALHGIPHKLHHSKFRNHSFSGFYFTPKQVQNQPQTVISYFQYYAQQSKTDRFIGHYLL